MEIKKTCRFLILVFLVLSLLFYSLYLAEIENRTKIPDELIYGVVENLSKSGIEINSSIIDANMPEKDIYYFEIESLKEYNMKIAESISFGVFGKDILTTEFDTPEGSAVGILNGNDSKRELGRILFYENDSSFAFSKNGVNMQYGDEPIINMQTDSIDEVVLSDIDRIISGMADDSELGYRISGSSSSDDFIIVTAMQTIDGYDINDSFINFVYSNDNLVIMRGKWIMGNPKAKYHNTLLDGVNVLYKLNLEQVKSILSEEVVYSLRISENGKCFILPCWRIEYTDKNDNIKTSFFDAL